MWSDDPVAEIILVHLAMAIMAVGLFWYFWSRGWMDEL
jgi:hypothetical protein